MNIKKFKIISIILAFTLCFPLHFLYDVFPSFITSIFSPVNESIWEHMKLLFGSIIFTGVLGKIYILIKKEKINNICFSTFIAACSSIPIFLIMFLPIYYIIGHNMVITIAIMFISITIAELISYIIMTKKDFKLENITILFTIAVYVIFTILTYYPLKNNLFVDPTNNLYGVIKSHNI